MDVDFEGDRLHIRRSKTKAGLRTPPLKEICRQALLDLHEKNKNTVGAEPQHYVFPAGEVDPSRPMKDWRSAWRKIRKAAGLESLRFHDGRHYAITVAGENGIPIPVMLELFGDMDPEMLEHYSHPRQQALEAASNALVPSFWRSTTTEATQLVN